MIDMLKYSSSETNNINNARRNLWVSRYMLGEANRNPEEFDKSLWLTVINRERHQLRRIAKALRAKLPKRKLYRFELYGDAIAFTIWQRAHTPEKAIDQVIEQYGDAFKMSHPMEVQG